MLCLFLFFLRRVFFFEVVFFFRRTGDFRFIKVFYRKHYVATGLKSHLTIEEELEVIITKQQYQLFHFLFDESVEPVLCENLLRYFVKNYMHH